MPVSLCLQPEMNVDPGWLIRVRKNRYLDSVLGNTAPLKRARSVDHLHLAQQYRRPHRMALSPAHRTLSPPSSSTLLSPLRPASTTPLQVLTVGGIDVLSSLASPPDLIDLLIPSIFNRHC